MLKIKWQPTPVLLPGKSHGRSSLEGCSPWGHWGLDTTERLYFHFSLSCIGEGNGNPLQCSCLENPRDGGAWWAAVYGVVQSRTRLKWLSSSSNLPNDKPSILAWRIPWTEEPGRLQSIRSQRVRRALACTQRITNLPSRRWAFALITGCFPHKWRHAQVFPRAPSEKL